MLPNVSVSVFCYCRMNRRIRVVFTRVWRSAPLLRRRDVFKFVIDILYQLIISYVCIMKQFESETAPAGCVAVCAKTVTDDRGALTFVEKGVLPFAVERIFWITSVPEGKTRGGHAHKTCVEAVWAAKGAFDITVDDAVNAVTVHISADGAGIIVPAGAWCELCNFTADCVCVVAASQSYDSEGYVSSYDEYLRLRREGGM